MERETEREEALWRLARHLYEAMDKLDPSGFDWTSLNETERSLYYFAIKSVLTEHREVARIVETDLANYNMVIGRSVGGK